MKKIVVGSIACATILTLGASVVLAQPAVSKRPIPTVPHPKARIDIKPVLPVLTDVQPGVAYHGATVTVTGSAFDVPNGPKAQAVLTVGNKILRAPLTSIGDGKYRFVVPDPYAGETPQSTLSMAATAQRIHLEGVGGTSAELPFAVQTTVLRGIVVGGAIQATPIVHAGDTISLKGLLSPSVDLVMFKYGAGQYTQPVHFGPTAPVHGDSGPLRELTAKVTVPNIFAGAGPGQIGVLLAKPVSVWVTHGGYGSNALPLKIVPAATTAPTATSAPASTCGVAKPGYTFRGIPECQTDTYTSNAMRGTPTHDAQCNYVCCTYVSGMTASACGGANHHQYPADCAQYGTSAQLMAGGCYSHQ